jgi:hypothetical protein
LYPEYVKIGEIYDLTVQNGDNCLGQRNIPWIDGKIQRRQTSAADAHYGFPSAVMCVEVKEQPGMYIWNNHRVITDERQYEIKKSSTRMA